MAMAATAIDAAVRLSDERSDHEEQDAVADEILSKRLLGRDVAKLARRNQLR